MTDDIYYLVERAVDVAFTQDKYLLNFYEILKSNKFTKKQTTDFIESATAAHLSSTVEELNVYLEQGMKDKDVSPGYSYLGKPRARKIRDYLYKILEDAWQYEKDKRPGRKKGSKNKTRKYASK